MALLTEAFVPGAAPPSLPVARLAAAPGRATRAPERGTPWTLAAAASALAAGVAVKRRATRASAGARTAVGMGAEAGLLKKNRKKMREMEVEMMEGALKTLFARMDEPDIYKVREILMRLAKTNPRPNQSLAGDWIIFWASREGCIDKLFGTGMTDEGWWMQMQEYLLRFGKKKEGRVCEAIEIIRKVGPFPNQSNCLRGKYAISGTNRLKITFKEMKTDEGKDLEFREGKDKLVVDVDVIYSSKNMIAIQWEDANGECDFYVLTRVSNIIAERDKFVGTSRARYFFN
ncbi:unnamed protein product [Symbiodinium natans]|uniref:Plastid lipid-associated protein/fibrillin conserved domain-containing protein n=1 Tax=Symbiodinium natans TaxID=878477 RepID=A0A812H2E8_9DINO|nr:unnamed protein product [Symbiodinium natans]